jgi:asparagine synthase (glutamine-hydrolysing)
MIPLRDWLRRELRYLLDEYLNAHRIRREGLFSAPEVTSLVRQHVDNRANHSHLLWSLVSFQMWKERYLD